MLWKDHSGRSVKTHLKMKPATKGPRKEAPAGYTKRK